MQKPENYSFFAMQEMVKMPEGVLRPIVLKVPEQTMAAVHVNVLRVDENKRDNCSEHEEGNIKP